MDTQTFHIKIVFEVIETFLNGIPVPVCLKSFRLFPDMIAYRHEPAGMIPFMPVDGFPVVIYPDTSYRCFMNQKELIVISGMLLYMPAISSS